MASRNASVDFAKMLAAVFVVGIHTRVFSDISGVADFVLCDIIFRIAVPFFAVCTGYYIAKKIIDEGKCSWVPVSKMASKALMLYVIWSLFYLVNLVFAWYRSDMLTLGSFVEWFRSFLIGESYYHLWYLSQLFIALLLYYPLVKYLSVKQQVALSIVLWITGVYAGIYSDVINIGRGFVNFYERFGSYTGAIGRMLPLLLIGSVLARIPRIKLKRSWILTLLSLICLFGEVLLLKWIGAKRFGYELFTLPLAFFLFSSIVQTTVICSFDTRNIAKASLYVYVLHPAVFNVLQQIMAPSHIWSFVLVTFISILLSLSIVWISQHFRIHRNRLSPC